MTWFIIVSDSNQCRVESDGETVSVSSSVDPAEQTTTDDDVQIVESSNAKKFTSSLPADSNEVDDDDIMVTLDDGEVSVLDSPKSLCRQLIDQIRQEEFGVNIVLSEDGERLMTKQQERLGRSLERLSSDLYSKDTHFVLELIQNADDNDYPEVMMATETEWVNYVASV